MSGSYKSADGKMRVSSVSYLYDIAQGKVADHSIVHAPGANGDIGTAWEDVISQGGTFAFPAAEIGMEIVSTSDEDSAAGGTKAVGDGIRTVEVHYLDDTFTERVEVVVLDGTIVIALTATDIYRIQSVHALTTGSTKEAEGVISLRGLSDTPIYAQIAVGDNEARMAIYTVPIGKSLYITSWNASVAGIKYATFELQATVFPSELTLSDGIFFTLDEALVDQGSVLVNVDGPHKIPAGADVKIRAIASAASTVTAAHFEGWLE